MFEEILSHDPIKAYLRKALQNHQLPHALLFSGPTSIGKRTLAELVAAQLLGSRHSRDLHHLFPDTKNGLYSIDLLKDVISKAQRTPFEHPAKVFLIEAADKLVSPAAHAWLKTLEEPPPNTYFFLITSHKEDLLPTLRSRCVELSFQPLPPSTLLTLLQRQYPTHEREPLERAARLSQGSFKTALSLLDPTWVQKQQERLLALSQLQTIDCEGIDFEELLKEILGWFRDQKLQEVRGAPHLLFYPNAARFLGTFPQTIEAQIEETHTAFLRQIKPSVCLEALLSRWGSCS